MRQSFPGCKAFSTPAMFFVFINLDRPLL
jgi:glycine/serine hydroxymethyltransferase